MTYRIEVKPDAPIIVIRHDVGSHVVEYLADLGRDMLRLLDEQTEPVFVIADLSNVAMDLDDHMQASDVSARDEHAMMHHPNVRENIFVGADPLVRMAAKGLESATFGLTRMAHFDTLDEALAYCYHHLGAAIG